MFRRLQQKWGVNSWQLVLIITTFALGGSACGYLARKVLVVFNLNTGFLFLPLYLILITLLWPICVIVISIPLGQFSFFKIYIAKIFRRLKSK